MVLRNYTPHPLVLYSGGEIVATLPNSGNARVKTDLKPCAPIAHGGALWPTVATTFGEIEDLPAPQEGVFLVVSSLTAKAAKREGRTVDDLLTPAALVRDDAGHVIGCRALSRVGGDE